MDAWIDCMTSLDAPADGMSNVHSEPGTVLTLELDNVQGFANRCPEPCKALIECSAFVNWRRLEQPSINRDLKVAVQLLYKWLQKRPETPRKYFLRSISHNNVHKTWSFRNQQVNGSSPFVGSISFLIFPKKLF
jgi:hypothetical protein